MFLNRFSDNGNPTHNVMQIKISWIIYITVWSHLCKKCMYFQSPNQFTFIQFSSAQLLSRVRLFVTPWTEAHQVSLSISNSQSPPKLMSIKSVMPSSHLILCHPLLLLPPSHPGIMVFSNESALRIRGPKYWSVSFSISPSNEHPGLISFRMDGLDPMNWTLSSC